MYADGQIIVHVLGLETVVQAWRKIHRLNGHTAQYNLNISVQKIKGTAFTGKYPIQSNIVLNDKILWVSYCQYLTCDISYGTDKDVNRKLISFRRSMKLLNECYKRGWWNKYTWTFIKLWLCRLVWFRHVSHIHAVEMRFFRYVRKCTRTGRMRNHVVGPENWNIFSMTGFMNSGQCG